MIYFLTLQQQTYVYNKWTPRPVKYHKLLKHMFVKYIELNILPLQAQYILSMSMFVIANKELFTFSPQVHICSTRTIYDLHYPQTNLAQFQNGIFCMGIKIFN
jgi:hypothetical protein